MKSNENLKTSAISSQRSKICYAFFKDKLWCDLEDDKEKMLFLKSGRAVQTGIVAPGLIDELVEVYKFRSENKA
jgi:hypothetical protein